MANQNQSGRYMGGSSDENRPSWRLHDQGMRDDRDDERSMSDRDRDRMRRDQQDEGYRMSERYGQGQSGYGAGRYGEDRSLGYGGRYEDRQHSGMGYEDRFSRYPDRWQQDRQQQDRQQDRGFGGMQGGGYGQTGYGVGGFNQQTSFGVEGREGYGTQGPGQGRSGGYSQPGGGSYSTGMGGGQSGMGSGMGGGMGSGMGGMGSMSGRGGYGSQSFNMQSGGYGGYGQQGSTQSGFGQREELRGQHRGKGPQGWVRSDDRIRDMICETLSDDEHVDASNIEVTVKSGEVTLTGMVPDRQTKRMAEDIVERISGVKDVTNQIKIGQDRQSMSRGVGKNEPETTGSKHRA